MRYTIWQGGERMTGERRQQILQQFGRRVRAARILRGTTLQECATQAGISYSNLSMIERGKRSMYIEHLPALAQALGVSVQYLLGEEDQESGSEPPQRAPRAQDQEATAPQSTRQRMRKAAPVADCIPDPV
jgi:transcriptional regulator with XRE-family HTH domain